MARTIMIAGHAKLPRGMAARDVYETLTVTAEIDPKYGVIVEASCTLLTIHAQNFLNDLLRGYSLIEGQEQILEAIQNGYHGKAKDALMAACKDMYYYYVNSKTIEHV
ncbi:uncharacterized protein DUF3870 [Scopulibacillus darangshiensis]|uniref:Uncharacterized protein DUF3870 n=1 Tax=Scopulibacillus darangshiensis TaxID=442528 RepID=A0A4R2NXT5_9BACL|nr:DUF3870 domain-containing protein [Scopulibacillus darangshiensis]TCP27033.1 uncharacterized protein DUF3870 [Scopulibacillus darangshiensis]